MLALSLNVPVASAHELLPKALQEYMTGHPDATSEEIQDFIRAQAPEFAEKYKDKDRVIEIIRNQDTGLFDNMFDFMRLGVGHILAGADHILFVLSLLLVFVSVREILKLTITFTIAHSLTLILAGTSVLVLSPKVVEPIIALSITFVALTSVFCRDNKYLSGIRAKLTMVFVFGLFHGLGFAGLLEEIHVPREKLVSSLLAFNIGIEIGQILIVLIALPFILYAKDKPWYGTLIKIVAVLIAILGIFWAVQRVFF